METKETKYKELIKRIKILIEGETDIIVIMSTISSEVYHTFSHFTWVGFYRVVNENTLKVGPYQGKHGCLEISFNRGVCGKCAREQKIQLVNDVEKPEFHITCSAETKSEIVIPVLNIQKKLIAVFDIDSVNINAFNEVDEINLSKITALFRERILS